MTLTTTISICIFILGATFGLMKIIYDIVMNRVENLEQKQATQELRINTLENFNTMVVDRIEKDIDEIRKSIDEIKKIINEKMHRDANIITAQQAVIERVSKMLDDRDKVNL